MPLCVNHTHLLFVEKGIRGGVSQCCSRYSEANSRYMGEDYNPEKEDVHLMYYDINNLYGWAMAQYLPYGGFEWDDAKDYLTLPEDSEYEYILEVDLEYPESLHDSHKDLPLCLEHACQPGSKQRKLLTTLKAKHKYVIHYRSLQQAVRLGVRVTKVHRALKFKQGPWLKSYIDLNTEKRKDGKNTFEKQQYKLCNNAIFGKTMENVRKRIDVKLVSSWNGRYGAEAQISKPNFHSRAIFDENLVAIQLSKTVVTIDKPVYVGFSILDSVTTCPELPTPCPGATKTSWPSQQQRGRGAIKMHTSIPGNSYRTLLPKKKNLRVRIKELYHKKYPLQRQDFMDEAPPQKFQVRHILMHQS
ncbi:hypothetical protein TKK_0009480 [Trichogramma kaykai]